MYARATYLDEMKLSKAARTGIDIFARPGAPVIAVQDGKIVGMGVNARLGRFVRLRDAYGNTYTYAQLKKVAKAYPAPKKVSVTRAQVARELALPKADPKPTEPASAGVQQAAPQHLASALKQVRKVAPAVSAVVRRAHAVERLFANPHRPAAFHHGGQQQILNADRNIGHYTVFTSKFSKVFGLKRDAIRSHARLPPWPRFTRDPDGVGACWVSSA